ncbi:uncharacterized protein [Spinacia oleracea]|uniref:Uncharacterized protein isoform X2 n=1 Tax=Spinacia oleracea TaxID=3562 RepID=A0ABM3RUR4_SPIOL|nr:uncharacterized protein LOC110798640 isoform X2 [Spinacia oleracea]
MSHKIVMNLYSYASKTIFRNIGETGRPPSSHSSTSLRDSPPFPSPPIHFSLSSVLPRRNGCFLASPSFWSPLMWFLLLLLLRYCLWCCFAFSFSFPVQSTIVVSNCRIRQPTTQLEAKLPYVVSSTNIDALERFGIREEQKFQFLGNCSAPSKP